ncbi:MAG: GNAT family protein [Bacteroidaceae bacterium]|nr:GNAT family N-acetyltransferase [Bacteroidaceae bacterium]
MQIETERLLMRPIIAEDAADIFEYSREPNVGPNAGWKPHESIEESRDIMNKIFIGHKNIFGMVLKGTNKVIGSIGLIADPRRINPQVLMLGYAMSEHCWGKQLMTEAAKAIVAYGFETLSLDMISCTCYPYNNRSRRVIQKCGFQYEGRLLQCEVRYDGIIMDLESFLLTQNEWMAIKSKICQKGDLGPTT